MNSSGMNTAISDSVSEMMVKPISLAPLSAAWNGLSPSSMWRTMFSIMTMASSTTKPVPMVSAISDRLSSEKPQNHITPKVAISDSGSATPAMMVARMVRRKMNTTRMTSATLSTSVNCTSRIDARMVLVASCTTVSSTPAGNARCSRGSSRWMRCTVSTTLAPGWRWMSTTTAGLPLYQAPTLLFSSPSIDVGDVLEQHRRVVAVGDDDVAIGLGGGDLLVGGDGVGLVRAVERAGGAGDIGGDDHGAQVLEPDAVVGEPRQVGLDADRRLEPALHGDLADAGHLAQPLRQHACRRGRRAAAARSSARSAPA